jgi:hypothetical protein
MKFPQKKYRCRHTRRRGIAIVYFALGMVAFVGIASLSVDIGHLYARKAAAQRAADAAALAGAYRFASFQASAGAPAYAHQTAHYYAHLNGYNGVDPYSAGDTGATGVTVTTTYPVPGRPFNNFRVRVARAEPLFFAQIFGLRTAVVSASATALYTTLAPMSITGGGQYGQPNGPTSLSMFGPTGFYNNGDYRSVQTLANGSTNPEYDGKGYDFSVNIPVGFGSVDFEIYDPDSYNAGGEPNAIAGETVDELRTPSGGAGNSTHATTTRYRLYYDNDTPDNINDDVLINTKSYGNDSTTDMKWAKVFNFNRASYGAGNFRLNATTTAGSSENGFNLRVNKAGQTFNANNGTSITAQGHLPMNFNQGGNATITIGYVPAAAAGATLDIRKFDTDVGSQQVIYTCDTLPGMSWTGVLSGNGQFTTDTLNIPANYTGGNWKATYTAGAQDTSVWEMSYSGYGPGRPGKIKLVQ